MHISGYSSWCNNQHACISIRTSKTSLVHLELLSCAVVWSSPSKYSLFPLQEFLLESFAGGTEGLMLKALDVAAGYQPSKRSDSWIKLKR